MSRAPAAARDAARVAQVGYTAVIDRVTPEHTHEIIAANVARSTANAGGAHAGLPSLEQAWGPAHRREAVTLFEEHRLDGTFGSEGLLAFGITTQSQGHVAAVAATAVFQRPSARLRTDAVTLSCALLAVLDTVGPGVALAALAERFGAGSAEVSRSAQLLVLELDGAGGRVLAQSAPLVEGQVLAVAAIARVHEGPIVYQTTVMVSAEGAERLDAVPLRLIELR